jgi:hypothetical protein
MVQTFAISKAVESLSLVESKFNLVQSSDDRFFTEWYENLPALSNAEETILDRYKQRFLDHRYRGNLSEGAVDRLLVSPLLDLAGLYAPDLKLDTEASVEITAEDDGNLYRGRIDVLILQQQFWVLVVEEKASRIAMETAIPQGLTYMAGMPSSSDRPIFGLVTSGDHSVFIKLQDKTYALSDSFAIRSRHNNLYTVLQILKTVRDRIGSALPVG